MTQQLIEKPAAGSSSSEFPATPIDQQFVVYMLGISDRDQ